MLAFAIPDWATRITPTVQAALLADPKVNFIIIMYDSMAQFVVPAITITKSTDRVQTDGFNGTPFVLGMIQEGKVNMDVGENLDWVGHAIIDAEMRIVCGLPQVLDPKIPFCIFDKSNAADAGAPPEANKGYGDEYVDGLREAMDAEIGNRTVELQADSNTGEPALELRRLSKAFGGQMALREVDFTVLPGEVHGLLGQNGSGKSTLIKILAGFHEPDPGAELRIAGRVVPLPAPPGAFRALGFSFVHQNLALAPTLTVLENLMLTRLALSRSLRINWRAERAAARATLASYKLDIDAARNSRGFPRWSARSLPSFAPSRRWVTSAGCLVLDEPTPFLPRRDVERLFRMMRQVAANRAAVVFVSHDIDEVMEITDRATVLRDGQVAGTLETAKAGRDAFVHMIVGRSLEAAALRPAPAVARPAVAARDVSGGQVDKLTIELRPGEVVGLTGLLGSGYEQVPYLLYGAMRARAGALELPAGRHELATFSPAAALRAGVVLIPGDRPVAGGVGALPVVDNVTLPALAGQFRPWLLRRREMLRAAEELGVAFGVAPNRPALNLSTLSGGNQQKVILAKWLQLQPALVLLDEPTQGVDVGARQTVFRAIRDAAAAGACVLCASSDADQLAELCDRVLIMARGRVSAEIAPPSLNKHAIIANCYGAAA